MAAQHIEVAPGFRVGRVIGTSMSIWMKNIPLFGGLSLVAHLPGLLVQLNFPASTVPDPQVHQLAVGLTTGMCNLIFVQVLVATIAYGVFQQLRDRPIEIGTCVGVGIRRMLPVLGTSLAASFLAVLAAILFVIPGFMVAMALWVAIPACVAENLGVSDSLHRSVGLTKGFRWQILGVYLLLIVLAVGCGLVIGFVAGLGFAIGHIPLTPAVMVVQYIVTSLMSALSAVCITTGYYYLRVTKEGVDIDQIAAVFD
jgi:hypothetical protein